MSTIVTRAGKGSALTHNEVDANFVNLNTDKIEAAQSVTLTNKTIALGSNTVSGTTAQFNTALTDGDFATLAGSETLTNKTISGSSNTLSNIGNSSLTNSSVTIGSTSVSLGSTATTVSGLTLSSPTISGGTVNNASVGATTPSTGAFTTLSASSTVSGTGFSTYLASPPAIGGTTPAAGSFTTLSATGVTTVQAGTAAAPAITTSGDANTGIFFPAADTVAIGTGGTERLRVDSAGNAGLGVTPSAWDATSRALQFSTGAIEARASSLSINNNAYFSAGAWKFVSTGGATLYNQTAGNHIWYSGGSGSANANIPFSQQMTLECGATLDRTAFYLGASSSLFSFAGRGSVEINGSSESLFGFARGGAASAYVLSSSVDCRIVNINNTPMVFWTNNTERARITSGGSLIVGGTSVSYTGAMSEFQQSSGSCYVSINRTGTLANGDQASIYAVGGSRQAATFVYKHSGITNPCGALNVQCEDAEQNYLWADNSDVLRISTNAANIGTTGGTVVGTQTSDERLKNISGAISYGLTEVMALQPIAFAMKDDPETAKIGFSAQQVQPIIPESVYDTGECIDGYDVDPEDKLITTPKSDRTKLAMEYTQLIPVLTKAIQELNAKVEAQAAEIAALKGNA